MTILNCPKCGGTHYGSLECPMSAESIREIKEYDMDHGAAMEMPRYKCHKVVHALKIGDVTGETITPADARYAPFRVDASMFARFTPQAGDYYVVYEDGYKSFSPAKAFEDGYTLIA